MYAQKHLLYENICIKITCKLRKIITKSLQIHQFYGTQAKKILQMSKKIAIVKSIYTGRIP